MATINSTQDECLACGSLQTRRLRVADTVLIRCDSCGSAATHSSSTDADEQEKYQREYSLTKYAHSLEIEARRISRTTEQWGLLAALRRMFPKAESIVDVGCDRGGFLDEARRLGYRVQGVEPSLAAGEYARLTGLPVASSLQEIDQRFDVLTLWHVLEHIPAPMPFLQECRRVLAPEGGIAIRVPAATSFWARVLKHRWVWFQPRFHALHFSPKGLTLLLERNGFVVDSCVVQRPNTLKTTLHWFAVAFGVRSLGGVPPKRHLSVLWQWLTGVEIFAVAHKKAESALAD